MATLNKLCLGHGWGQRQYVKCNEFLVLSFGRFIYVVFVGLNMVYYYTQVFIWMYFWYFFSMDKNRDFMTATSSLCKTIQLTLAFTSLCKVTALLSSQSREWRFHHIWVWQHFDYWPLPLSSAQSLLCSEDSVLYWGGAYCSLFPIEQRLPLHFIANVTQSLVADFWSTLGEKQTVLNVCVPQPNEMTCWPSMLLAPNVNSLQQIQY